MKSNPPCKDCAERRMRCHSMCIKYAAWCYNHKEYKAKADRNKKTYEDYCESAKKRTPRK